MIKISPPELDPGEVFRTCISRIRSSELKSRLVNVNQHVIAASARYEQLARTTSLHQFPREAIVGGIISTAEMEAVYSQRMARKGSAGRDYYNRIINCTPHGKCPLCGHRIASTVDHYLPKIHYPILSVTPLNLVPACSDCNKLKLSSYPVSAEDETLHPYFDDIMNERWLFATVREGSPAALSFSVSAPQGWSQVLNDRVSRHFRTLGLASLYSAQAADELLNIRHQLHIIYHADGGINAVRNELNARAESCRQININSWRAATFEALASSDWFCDEGFELT